ncbi:hypothetical protein ASG25_10745 [Rhizobium sp. Leaf384]|uniref:helix-turn-helix domain-containing protein n=1 Tax=Rhizobium sp. Leaf384 TaxID=1736358 RepID=UPI000713A61B|nr:helix-turn-helix domain-containing protein [Rhizobium sp. Leaf384]KQS79055.1 hypothetical protein ASG25_10745 [Rhizobium sp. Leaf384]
MQPNQNVEIGAKIHAAQVRARLFGSKPAVARLIAPGAAPPAESSARASAAMAMRPKDGSIPPRWRVVATHFNQHMIHYREWQKQAEEAFEENSACRRSMLQITTEVLEAFPGVTLREVKGSSRLRRILAPRQLAMHRIKSERPDLSYPAIGRFFGGRDHTTVLHAIRKIEDLIRGGRI